MTVYEMYQDIAYKKLIVLSNRYYLNLEERKEINKEYDILLHNYLLFIKHLEKII